MDALRFEQLAGDGRHHLRAGAPRSAATALGEAVALWGDRPGVEPALVADLAPAVATRLAHASIEAVVDLADAELALGHADAATVRLTALLTEHPVHERAAALLMDALAAQGRQAEALARIGTLLTAGRLVTVVGPGGAGKTRLAVEAARHHRTEYRDGAWMIDLASVTEPTKVGAALLAAIGLRGSALFEASAKLRGDARGELDLLADQLGGRECLLVVDNCEHLIDAVAHLVSALLARCAGLRVLATSREPLAIDGESLVLLGPLALPAPHTDVARARRSPSVLLFSERAAAVRPGFDVDERNLGDVLRVVRSLDGLPLALELAAARLRTLSLPDLAAGLSDRFRLLTTGSRTAAPRHRTLRAVIAWSWDLLGADARTVAERIAVLPGGVTPASATAVCAGTAVPAADVRDLLADLVDRSLLHLAPDTGRYRMLETIREYGLERLAEEDTPTDVRDLAARHFAELVARQDPLLRGPDQLDALHALHAEYDNVLAALRHLHDAGDADRATGLAVNLIWCWRMLGRHADAAYWLGAAVALPVEQPSAERDIAEGMLLLNFLATPSTLVVDVSEERGEELRALVGRLRNHPELPGVGGALLAARLAALDADDAPSTFLQRLVDGPDPWLAGLARMFRAHFAENEAHLDQVRSDVPAALEYFDRAGDRWALAKALPLRALLRQYDGDLDGALADLDEAKRLARTFGSLSLDDEVFIDLRRVDVHERLDDDARAGRLVAAARERARRSASPELAIVLDAREAGLCVRTGDLERARELVESAEAGLSEQLPVVGLHGRALVATARAALCLALGDGPGAEEALDRAYAVAVDSRDMPFAATVVVTVAGLAALHGRHRDAGSARRGGPSAGRPRPHRPAGPRAEQPQPARARRRPLRRGVRGRLEPGPGGGPGPHRSGAPALRAATVRGTSRTGRRRAAVILRGRQTGCRGC